ncbi:hypothetical protein, partial [Salmonella sp. s51228]|uniref:hypothetical protein n=1 Tax=Salmonella sp. s51228 TaxID=3159652 RepID=UPI0039815DBD
KDADIFNLREKEKLSLRNERDLMKSLKVHQKSTYSSRTNQKSLMARNPVKDIEDFKITEPAVNGLGKIALATARDPLVEKESMSDFVSKKREMF